MTLAIPAELDMKNRRHELRFDLELLTEWKIGHRDTECTEKKHRENLMISRSVLCGLCVSVAILLEPLGITTRTPPAPGTSSNPPCPGLLPWGRWFPARFDRWFPWWLRRAWSPGRP